MEARITPETNLHQLFTDCPAVIPLFIKERLACVGCGMSRFETLGDMACSYQMGLADLIAEIETIISLQTVRVQQTVPTDGNQEGR